MRGVVAGLREFADKASAKRGVTATYAERQTVPATPMDGRIVGALTDAAAATGEPHISMISGAAHDTMCIAGRVPSAMLFIPCRDGLSHTPLEHAEPVDAALGAEAILNAIRLIAKELTLLSSGRGTPHGRRRAAAIGGICRSPRPQ